VVVTLNVLSFALYIVSFNPKRRCEIGKQKVAALLQNLNSREIILRVLISVIIIIINIIIIIIIIWLYSQCRALASAFWGFLTINSLQGWIVSPVPNPQPGGPRLHIYDPPEKGPGEAP
jgi:hypothetical protein